MPSRMSIGLCRLPVAHCANSGLQAGPRAAGRRRRRSPNGGCAARRRRLRARRRRTASGHCGLGARALGGAAVAVPRRSPAVVGAATDRARARSRSARASAIAAAAARQPRRPRRSSGAGLCAGRAGRGRAAPPSRPASRERSAGSRLRRHVMRARPAAGETPRGRQRRAKRRRVQAGRGSRQGRATRRAAGISGARGAPTHRRADRHCRRSIGPRAAAAFSGAARLRSRAA